MNITLSSIYEKYALEWAIDHADFGSFTYYVKINGVLTSYNSSDFVKQALFFFRQGFGHFLPKNATLKLNYSSEVSENETTEFETRLLDAIYVLTAQKPVIKDLDDKRAIFKE